MMFDPDLYRRVREAEGRVYSDAVVARLPEVAPSHPHRQEWQARAAAFARLRADLARRPGQRRLLEVGCGSGWLISGLASHLGCAAWGVDQSPWELGQAARVFASRGVLFLRADIFTSPFPAGSFDVILLASVIQYFPDLAGLIESLLRLLRPGGEIHLLDSPLYVPGEVEPARARSLNYYRALGFPAMAGHYHHHLWTDLQPFRPRVLHDPRTARARLRRRLRLTQSPFPWLVVSA